MPQRVRISKVGLTLDRVVWEATGSPDASLVEQTLALNRGLASAGAILPLGREIVVPDRQPRTPRRTVRRLWD
jgi:phage tail protein X